MKGTFVNGTLTFVFSGRIDTEKGLSIDPDIKEEIARHKPKTVVFDLADVEYVASPFLRICLTTAKDVGEDNLLITNTSPEIKKIFRIAGLDDFLKIA